MNGIPTGGLREAHSTLDRLNDSHFVRFEDSMVGEGGQTGQQG